VRHMVFAVMVRGIMRLFHLGGWGELWTVDATEGHLVIVCESPIQLLFPLSAVIFLPFARPIFSKDLSSRQRFRPFSPRQS
jgi:hypothetical protein